MIELHFLRHAHAGDPAGWAGPDADRPLSDKGEKQADRLGRFLAGAAFETDAVISSPKLRASQTAEIVAGHLHVPVAIDDRLASGVDMQTIEAILHDAGDPGRPVLVGHDPDFSDLVAQLIGSPAAPMKKGAMVRIDIDHRLATGSGRIAWLLTPDLLKPAR